MTQLENDLRQAREAADHHVGSSAYERLALPLVVPETREQPVAKSASRTEKSAG